ncbi:hypothetical protein ACEWY4_017297 [Coilia grayii]|uniref:Uncharacterized protein n=1 Tax=Coilia grayii TaxID=363190 RepID=A0ABD1JJT9_9TELE
MLGNVICFDKALSTTRWIESKYAGCNLLQEVQIWLGSWKCVHEVSHDASEEEMVALANEMLLSTETLVGTLVEPTSTQSSTSVKTNTTEAETFAIGENSTVKASSKIRNTNITLDIDLTGIAKNNRRAAAVALTTYTEMGSILQADFFHTINDTEKTMMSPVLSASLPKTPKKTLTSPANFTIKHIQSVIIGTPWILGFFATDSKAVDIVFHVLNSQQGTFIFLLHCVLNQEVQQQYWNWLRKLSHANICQ